MKALYKKFFLLLFLLGNLLSISLQAKTTAKILILNSDQERTRYTDIQNEYSRQLPFDKVVLGLADLNIQKITNVIQEEAPSLIFCIGSIAYQAALSLEKKQPIIFTSIVNWRRFALPENAYGVELELPDTALLQTYKYYFPDIRSIGVVYSKSINEEWVQRAVKSAKDMGLKLKISAVAKPDLVINALEKLITTVDALWIIADPYVVNKKNIRIYFTLAKEHQKPIFAYNKLFIKLGAVMAIAADSKTISSQAAVLTAKIMDKDKDLKKIQAPAGLNIALNLKAVNDLKLNLNYEALGSVNEIIE